MAGGRCESKFVSLIYFLATLTGDENDDRVYIYVSVVSGRGGAFRIAPDCQATAEDCRKKILDGKRPEGTRFFAAAFSGVQPGHRPGFF